jgi:DNA-binding CsgD family transcriptional regulator
MHIKNIYSKLNVNNKAALIKMLSWFDMIM